ncbi:MAG: hypothetical protein LBN22_06855 [Clostridiales Family XIII bacterium]|jgi:hypothetical protein|nr:hypothetical protein [Clostridiales Family XIII bacterium]
MIESAIMYPIVILTMMALIYFSINEYACMSQKNDMHVKLRAQSYEDVGTVTSSMNASYIPDKYRQASESKTLDITKSSKLGADVYQASMTRQFMSGQLLGDITKYTANEKVYGVDESKRLNLYGAVTD